MEIKYKCQDPCDDVEKPCTFTVHLPDDDEGDIRPMVCPYDENHKPKWGKNS